MWSGLMQVQSIRNTNSNINYKSREDIEKASDLVNMSDNQLRQVALKLSYDKKEIKEKTKKTLQTAFWAIPIFDILSNGLLAKNILITEGKEIDAVLIEKATPLSTKAHGALRTAGMWAFVIGIYGAYKAVRKTFAPESEKPKNKHHYDKQKNPVASFLIDFAILLGSVSLLSAGIKQIMNGFPEGAGKMKNKYYGMLEKLDNTNLNTKVLPEFRRFAKSVPALTAISKFALANSFLIIVGIGLYKLFDIGHKQQDKVDATYRQLKKTQKEAKKYLEKKSALDEKNNKTSTIIIIGEITSAGKPALKAEKISGE